MNPLKSTIFLLFFLLQFTFAVGQKNVDTSFYYKHPTQSSCLSVLVNVVAKTFLPQNKIRKNVENPSFHSLPASIPAQVRKNVQIDTTLLLGRKVFKLSPKYEKSTKTVVFLHGGGYVYNIFRQHWIFASKLVLSTNCTVLIPDYPLAPKSNSSDAFQLLDLLYEQLLSEVNSENIIFMGDSAGGGLALAFAQKLTLAKKELPSQLILIAPWLDVSLTNPAIDSIQKMDPILKVKDLTSIHATWVKDISIKHSDVSPLYGDLIGLPKISIFIGTHDILLADCQSLKAKLEGNKVAFNYFEYPKMLHDWVMYIPLKESNFSIKQIGELIK